MLWPAMSRLHRWGVGRITATLVTVAIASLLIGGLMAVGATPLLDLANNLPTYEYNLLNKVPELKVASSWDGVVKRTSELIKELGRELEQPSKSDQSTGSKPEGEREPIPVEVHPPKPSPLEVIGSAVWPLLKPVATAGVVVVFVIFILLYREDLRD